MTASIPHVETGTVVGGYRIEGIAGQRGMGVVCGVMDDLHAGRWHVLAGLWRERPLLAGAAT